MTEESKIMQDSFKENVEESTEDQFQRAGEALSAARKEKNFSLEQVSDRLKIPVAYLKAMEACHYDQLPGTTFARGYLRSYARLLELNEDYILGLFGETVQADEQVARLLQEKPLDHHGVPGGKWLAAASLILLGAFVLGCVAWWGAETRTNDVPFASRGAPVIDSNFGAAAVDVEPVIEEMNVQDELELKQPSALPEIVEPLRTGVAIEAATADLAPAQVAAVTDVVTNVADVTGGTELIAPVAPVTEIDNQLILRFDDDCWVEVKDAEGNVLFSDLQQGNSELSLEGDGPLNIKFGNTAAVSEVVFNGEPVALVNISASSRGIGRLTLG